MLTQTQWKIQLIAEHMCNTATAVATAAGHLSVQQLPMTKEHAVIADEIRHLSARILEVLEQNIYAGLPGIEFESLLQELSR